MNIVIDTNIIISAIISTRGNPYKILSLITNDESIRVYYSNEILNEYKRVLAYKRLNIPVETQIDILAKIKQFGILVEPTASTIPLPDETDRVFYDTAQASGAILITGNTKHYPTEPFIMPATDFIKYIET